MPYSPTNPHFQRLRPPAFVTRCVGGRGGRGPWVARPGLRVATAVKNDRFTEVGATSRDDMEILNFLVIRAKMTLLPSRRSRMS